MERGTGDTVFVCAHGAGGHQDDRGMLRLAEGLEPLQRHAGRAIAGAI